MTELLSPGDDSILSNQSNRPMIIADNVHVNYRVYASGKRVTGAESGLSLRSIRGGRDLKSVPALRGVSFTASEGETIGVIGHNGSGKSTLFRAMSGLVPPASGAIYARERPVLLGVNAALVPELSGENNIRLGLLAMGFSSEDAAARIDEIADFAELNDFIYHPMRTYSSGMGARLRFAIASAKAHSILLIDEALAVGDKRFREKSERRIDELRRSAGLVMIVSHSAGALRKSCERVLWVHKGELIADGPTDEVIDEYVAWTKKPGSSAVGAASTPVPATKFTPGITRSTVAPPADSGVSPVGGAGSSSEKVEDSRAARRRESFRRGVAKQRSRNIVLLSLTGAAILLAVAAGAILGTLAMADGQTELPATESSDQASEETQSTEALAIAAFTSSAATAECEAEDGKVDLQLSWQIRGATSVALAIGESEVDALGAPTRAGLPTQAAGYTVPFSCATETTVYTLTAENEAGERVNAPIQILRTVPEDADSEPGSDSTPVTPARPQVPSQPAPGPVAPQPAPSSDPAPADPAPSEPVPTEPSPSIPPAPTNPEVPPPGEEIPPVTGADPVEGEAPETP